MRCTLTGWATCVWCLTRWSHSAKSMARALPGRAKWACWANLSPSSAQPWCRATTALATGSFIAQLESRGQPYLFKLRQTAGVKKFLARRFARDDRSTPGPSDQGYSAVQDTLELSGRDQHLRVITVWSVLSSMRGRPCCTSGRCMQLPPS